MTYQIMTPAEAAGRHPGQPRQAQEASDMSQQALQDLRDALATATPALETKVALDLSAAFAAGSAAVLLLRRPGSVAGARA